MRAYISVPARPVEPYFHRLRLIREKYSHARSIAPLVKREKKIRNGFEFRRENARLLSSFFPLLFFFFSFLEQETEQNVKGERERKKEKKKEKTRDGEVGGIVSSGSLIIRFGFD